MVSCGVECKTFIPCRNCVCVCVCVLAGVGISRLDMAVVGEWDHTSKIGSNLNGCKGQALASIRQLSRSLDILSTTTGEAAVHKTMTPQESRLLLNNKNYSSSSSSSNSSSSNNYERVSTGTVVRVSGLFDCLPVRRQACRADQEWRRIQTFLHHMSVLHHAIAWTLSDCALSTSTSLLLSSSSLFTKQQLIHNQQQQKQQSLLVLQAVKSVSKRVLSLHGLGVLSKMHGLSFTDGKGQSIDGLLSLPRREDCHHQPRDCQYMYVNNRWMRGRDELSSFLNKVYAKALSESLNCGPSAKHVNKVQQSRYPHFVLKYQCPPADCDVLVDPDKALVVFKDAERVRQFLRKALKSFCGDRFPVFDEVLLRFSAVEGGPHPLLSLSTSSRAVGRANQSLLWADLCRDEPHSVASPKVNLFAEAFLFVDDDDDNNINHSNCDINKSINNNVRHVESSHMVTRSLSPSKRRKTSLSLATLPVVQRHGSSPSSSNSPSSTRSSSSTRKKKRIVVESAFCEVDRDKIVCKAGCTSSTQSQSQPQLQLQLHSQSLLQAQLQLQLSTQLHLPLQSQVQSQQEQSQSQSQERLTSHHTASPSPESLSQFSQAYLQRLPRVEPIFFTYQKAVIAQIALPEEVQLDREMLHTIRVVGQFANKFIVSMHGSLLLLFDQHAVDERTRYEVALASLRSSLHTVQLPVVAQCTCTLSERVVYSDRQQVFADWGFSYSLSKSGLTIATMPVVLEEQLTVDDLQEFNHFVDSHSQLPSSCLLPPAVLRIAASKACRSSIKFGSTLSLNEMNTLITKLTKTNLPFQCAHGRPSMLPISQLRSLQTAKSEVVKRRLKLHNLYS
jgi:DNA mismatch repair ATPase MutL